MRTLSVIIGDSEEIVGENGKLTDQPYKYRNMAKRKEKFTRASSYKDLCGVALFEA